MEQKEGQPEKKKQYRRSKNYRYNNRRNRNSNNDRRKNNNNRNDKRYYRRERKILGKCLICGSNVSDSIYGMKIDENYIHFECAVKKIRQQMREDSSNKQRNYKVYYTGSGNFSAVHEKNIKGNIKWQILLQVNVKDFPEVQSAKQQETEEDSTS